MEYMIINMGVRLPAEYWPKTDLPCEICGKRAIGVCAVVAQPYSGAFCATCLYFGAQPIICVEATYLCCSGDVADWYKDECRVWTLEHGYETVRSYDLRTNVWEKVKTEALADGA